MRAGQSRQIYQQRLNRVIDHIRDHLTGSLPLQELARLAHFSPFHFHRIFRAYTGEPLHAFIRRLRLEKAVFQLTHGPRTTLTDLALDCGFASSSDFSRAFKQAYGFSPRHYSRDRFLEESKIRQDLRSNVGYGFPELPKGYNPDRFRVRFVDWPRRTLVYERVIGACQPQHLLAAFERLMDWGRRHDLLATAQLLGMSQDDPDITPMKKYRFDWGLVLPPDVRPGREVNVTTIPANRFAVVHCCGDLHKELRAWQYLFNVWLPGSGYQPTQDPAMEVYRRSPLELGWETYDMDCYLPVKPLTSRFRN
jgi:AraC family transcriptional regulator